jgi:hypothetical protein
MRAHDRRIDHLNEMRSAARLGQERQHRLEYTPLAQPPKPLPHTIPLAKFSRQSTPGDIVNRKVMQRFQEFTIVPAAPAAARACRTKRLDNDLPLGIRHLGQHDRLLPANRLSITDAL